VGGFCRIYFFWWNLLGRSKRGQERRASREGGRWSFSPRFSVDFKGWERTERWGCCDAQNSLPLQDFFMDHSPTSPKMLDFFGEETDGNGGCVVILLIRSPGGRGKTILAGHPKFS